LEINRLHIREGLELFYCTLSPVDTLEFQSLLNDHELIKISHYKNPLRKKQFYWERYIVKAILGPGIEINYNESGKPFLLNSNQHISITHTPAFVAVAIGNENMGIDIEEPRPSLEKVKTRFLSTSEIARFNLTELKNLSFLWNLKEASLKFLGDATLDYQNQIEIISCDFKESALVKVNYKNEKIILKSSLKKIENHTLAVVYNDYTC
jgi:phosphopantetheinyl transferase